MKALNEKNKGIINTDGPWYQEITNAGLILHMEPMVLCANCFYATLSVDVEMFNWKNWILNRMVVLE